MEKKISRNKILQIGLFLVFAIMVLYLAFSIKMGISPDSYYHLEVSREYSTTLGIPDNTPDTYQWRDITRIPYLYFWINGRVLNLNSGFIDEITLLRVLNVIYSLGTVLITYFLSKEILKGKYKRLLPIFLLTSTLMFVFLSSSINYDNLANLFCVLSIFFFVKLVKSKLTLKYLLLMVLFLLIGGLTKFTVLPLAFILIALSIVDIIKKRELVKNIEWKRSIFLLIPIGIFLFLNFQVYGVNLIQYKALEPNCEQILTHEQCLQNGVYYRDNVTIPGIEINGFQQIASMVFEGERLDPIRYLPIWLLNITDKIYGIMGDSTLHIPTVQRVLYLILFVVAIIQGFISWKKWDLIDRYLLITVLFYTSVLFFVQNYNMYLQRNDYYLALQGRYIFPVITLIYILFSKSIFFVQRKTLKIIIFIATIVLFLYGCIPYFFLNAPDWWFK